MATRPRDAAEADDLLDRFERCVIPLEAWTHHTHLSVAIAYLRRLPLDAACDAMRRGIMAFNATHGIESRPDGGYHETITWAWMQVLAVVLREAPATADADAILERYPALLEKRLLLRFYSRDLIMSEDARTGIVQPDRAAFEEGLDR
ncbi:MAG: hypothetical protein HKO59_15605 [Phycisphaerales bacterium]|nr:hypothetical protein [Phycisphaerae bacterium]NNF44488.1 hypothetical protein [Phycisphaerales bacterium]NNM27381.1 hypothetical protein [Phycisphaerales bacterium]